MGLAVRNLQRRPRRAILTLVGLAVGAASYMGLVGAARGFTRQFAELARFGGADVVVSQAAATMPWSSSVLPDQVSALAGLPGVTHASRLGFGKARLPGSPFFLVFGIDPAEALARRIPLVRGHPLRASAGDILLGDVAARKLKLAVGQELVIRGRHFAVVGTYRTGYQLMDAGAVLDMPSFQTMFNLIETVSVVLLELATPARRGEIASSISTQFPGLEAHAWESWMSAFGQMELVESFARLLAILAVFIAALGVSNVMYVAVTERIRELAILRAVGWRRWRVAALVVREGLALSLLGGMAGIPLATGAFRLLASARVGGLDTVGFIPLSIPLSAALEGVAVTVLAGALGTLPPLLHALRMRPADALHIPA